MHPPLQLLLPFYHPQPPPPAAANPSSALTSLRATHELTAQHFDLRKPSIYSTIHLHIVTLVTFWLKIGGLDIHPKNEHFDTELWMAVYISIDCNFGQQKSLKCCHTFHPAWSDVLSRHTNPLPYDVFRGAQPMACGLFGPTESTTLTLSPAALGQLAQHFFEGKIPQNL